MDWNLSRVGAVALKEHWIDRPVRVIAGLELGSGQRCAILRYQPWRQRFLEGSFAGSYEKELIAKFEKHLPDRPPGSDRQEPPPCPCTPDWREQILAVDFSTIAPREPSSRD